ncbi:MAG: ABC transporter permease [Anaerolineae bacterium]|nr:ABC transporter permease [Anaerolineae bacterium]
MHALQRISQIVKKELLELWRHAGVIAFVLAIPVAEVIILGYATAGRVEDLPAVVYDADRTAASRRLADAIHQAPTFEVAAWVANISQAEQLLEGNKISAYFVIPQGFESALTTPTDEATVAAVIDGSNIAVANYAAVYTDEVIGHFMAQSLGGPNLRPQEQNTRGLPINVEPRLWYNQELRRETFFVPGLIGTMLSLVVLTITAVSIVGERERGTLEQLMVSPTRPTELIIGKLIPSGLIAYVELGLMVAVAVGIFHIPIRGSLVLYAGLMFVYLLAEMGTGILISTLSTSQAQALPSICLLVVVYAILAGFFTPVDTMPQVAQWASNLVPLKYFVAITRDLFAKGAGFDTLAPQLLPLIAISLVLFTASVLLLRRRLV